MVQRRNEVGIEAELAALDCVFTTGHDFFGLAHSRLGWPPRFSHGPGWIKRNRENKAKLDKLTREAWGRLGRAFMATWEPLPGGRELPYALEAWGEPWRR